MPKKKSKLQRKTKVSLIGACIVLLANGYQWFYSEGVSWLLQNLPPDVFHCWPKLHEWLFEQSTVPALLILSRSATISLLGVGLVIVSSRLKIKF